MAGILKVEALQNLDGSAPTAGDLGMVLAGSDIPDSSTYKTYCNGRQSQHALAGDSGWVDHIATTFTVTRDGSDALFIYSSSSSYESGAVQGFARILLDGQVVGFPSCVAKQSTANAAGAGTCIWDKQYISAGQHTVTVQIRNTVAGSTWITPYYSVDSSTSNTLTVIHYGK